MQRKFNMRTRPRLVTIIVHGTFAAQENWWRLGNGGEPSFGDRLEHSLAARGLGGTVWRPALRGGLSYDDFRWSGENRHRARMAGGLSLARALDRLADITGATREAPLAVNLVAHSHGGNVALEALCHMSDAVRPLNLVLLGTPLLRRRVAMRIVRVLLGLGLLALVVSLAIFAVARILGAYSVEGPNPWGLLAAAALAAVSSGWILLLVGDAVDGLLRGAVRAVQAAGRFGGDQVYGPPSGELERLLNRGSLVLFTSHQDEADLLLQLGSAPRRLYREWVRDRWTSLGRGMELVLLRPFTEGIALRLLSVILERFLLGFSWPSLLIWDYEMADLDRGTAYPRGVLRRVDVTEHLVGALRAHQEAAGAQGVLPVVGEVDGATGVARRAATLRATLVEVARGIKQQVRLRHSAYYTSQEVVTAVAAVLSESSAAWAAASRATGTRNGEQDT